MAKIVDYPSNPDIALRRMLASKGIPQAFQALRESPPESEHAQIDAFAERMLAVQAEVKAATLAGASMVEVATIAAGIRTHHQSRDSAVD